jgi:hypothetical protein
MNGSDLTSRQRQHNRTGKGHMSHDEYAQELEHIRTMILQVERLIHDDDPGQATAVTSPDYWLARLNAVVEAGLPAAFEPQVRALLARLDALRAAPRNRA